MKTLIIMAVTALSSYVFAYGACNFRQASTPAEFDKSAVDVCYNGLLQLQRDGILWDIAKKYGSYRHHHSISVIQGDDLRDDFHNLFDEIERIDRLIQYNTPCPVCPVCPTSSSSE